MVKTMRKPPVFQAPDIVSSWLIFKYKLEWFTFKNESGILETLEGFQYRK